jgi:nitroreductase
MNPIFERRSIRQYTTEPVGEELVEQLLHAAMAAPSAGDEQAWQFVVLRDREVLNQIPTFHPYSWMLLESPVAILVCGDTTREKYPEHFVLDCSAATQNILLMATFLGLGSVWVGVYPNEDRVTEFCKLLSLPKGIVPFSLVPIGYPAEVRPPKNNFDPSRIHYDKWLKDSHSL